MGFDIFCEICIATKNIFQTEMENYYLIPASKSLKMNISSLFELGHLTMNSKIQLWKLFIIILHCKGKV